jgi:beta-glucosidase
MNPGILSRQTTLRPRNDGWSFTSGGSQIQFCKDELLRLPPFQKICPLLTPILHSLARDYPASMRVQLGSRLPKFTPAEFSLLAETKPDWYGMNHYTAKFARANSTLPSITDFTGNVTELKENKSGLEIGPVSGVSWLQVCPQQFRKLLGWISSRYKIKIYVTENGCPCPGENELSVEDAIEDDFRVKYFQLYLDAISKAIYEDGVDVAGYFAWSLMDNFGEFSPYQTTS